MSFERIADEKIRAAMADGLFDNLPGSGRPICHDAYFATPEDLRICHSVLRSSGFVPEEVEVLREVGECRERLEKANGKGERVGILRALNHAQMKLDILREERRRRRPKV